MSNQTEREAILSQVKTREAILSSHKKESSYDVDKNGFTGTFSVKYPSLMEKMRIGTLRAQYLMGMPSSSVDVITDNIAFMTATLNVVVTDAPKWFDLNKMDDYEVLEAIFEPYKEWSDTFRRRDEPSSTSGSGKDADNEENLENDENIQSSDK